VRPGASNPCGPQCVCPRYVLHRQRLRIQLLRELAPSQRLQLAIAALTTRHCGAYNSPLRRLQLAIAALTTIATLATLATLATPGATLATLATWIRHRGAHVKFDIAAPPRPSYTSVFWLSSTTTTPLIRFCQGVVLDCILPNTLFVTFNDFISPNERSSRSPRTCRASQ
jgi:hypothetical protein